MQTSLAIFKEVGQARLKRIDEKKNIFESLQIHSVQGLTNVVR